MVLKSRMSKSVLVSVELMFTLTTAKVETLTASIPRTSKKTA